MSSAIANLFSWGFVVGVVLGFALSRAWCVYKVWRLDRVRPLPRGQRRSWWGAAAVDARYVAAAVGIGFLGWSIFQTQTNANEAHRITQEARMFALETRHCQQVLIAAIAQSGRITAENDAESESQRDALAAWLKALLNPPPDIARLNGADPIRQRYAIQVTERTNAIIDESQERQRQNEARRAPLPEPNCGRR